MAEFNLLAKKPLAIMMVCCIGFINATQMVYMIFSPVTKQIGSGLPLYFTLAAVFSLVSIYGLWMLKKWASWLYVGVLVLNQLMLVNMGLWEITAMLIPLFIVIVLFSNQDKMT